MFVCAVGVCNKLEEALGTDLNNPDSDGDGYLDGVEIKNNYDPLDRGLVKIQYNDQALINRVKGYILLQVESHGEAWYVNPKDGKRYYMTDGDAAYQIMRYLSLGITNIDLNTIPISSYTFELPVPPSNSDTQAPTAPTNLVATATSTQITLTWNNSTDNIGVSRYLIEKSIAATTGFSQITTVTNNSYVNTGLNANTTYYYRVRAQDAAGNLSGYSNIVFATTPNSTNVPPTDTQNPTTPTNLLTTATSTQITLTWTSSSDNIGVSQYLIERSLLATSSFSQIITVTNNSYVNTGLNSNTTYYYRVRAQDAAGNLSGYSNIAGAQTGQSSSDTQSPSIPTSLVATATSTVVSLAWLASTDNVGVTQYRIERSTNASADFSQIATSSITTYLSTGLDVNTTYYYRVRAQDAAGNLSGYSNIAHVTTIAPTQISSINGEDYALPSNVQMNDFSGLVSYGNPTAKMANVQLQWKQLEPTRGVYDFSVLENNLVNLQRDFNQKGLLMIESNTYSGLGGYTSVVPDWVLTRYNLDPNNLPNMGGPLQMKVIPIWWPEISKDFNSMIRALKDRYQNDPRIGGIYILAASPGGGEEFYAGSDAELLALEKDWGFTPAAVETWLKEKIDAYDYAFAGNEYKLAWVGGTESFKWRGALPDGALWEQMEDNVYDYNNSKGNGWRCGGTEFFLSSLNEEAWSSTIDADGYLHIDESSQNFHLDRYRGEENEQYGPAYFDTYGEHHSDPYRLRMSVLRALQSQFNWSWSNSVAENLNPALSLYGRLSKAKTVYNSADAWALLFETPASTWVSPAGKVKNFERWLIKRDIPGGMTVAVLPYDRGFNAGTDDNANQYHIDYTARRTDRASGNKYMYFGLDDRFVVNGPVQLKVELVDNSAASWQIEYYNVNNILVSTPIIAGLNDGKIKTYTLTINGAVFQNYFNSNMDFRLVSTGPGDVTVRWVRLVR